MNQQTVIFFGPSGAGKGTQAKLLKEYLEKSDPSVKALYFGTGERIRNFVKENKNDTALRIEKILSEGGLLPSFLPVWLWSQFLVNEYTGSEHLIFDGTRRVLEVEALDTALCFYEKEEVHIVVLNVSKEWSITRLTERGREDDKSTEDIESRLSWYETEVVPAINFFKETGERYIVHDINGEQIIEEVHSDITQALNI